ncbi:MAG: porin [Gallionella sp.]|nr:porin [Gallionella sp.]
MQKKIIALAIAAAISAPAFADTSSVTVYGKADMSYDYITTGTSAAAVAGVSKGNVSSNVSKFGIKGSEDLGDGLAAVWQIEQQVNMDNTTAAGGTGTLATRNTFLGLKSDTAGTVLMGRHDTPYKISTRALDVFGDNIADNRSLMGGVSGRTAAASFDGRQTDVIAYISPSLSGFTGAIAYVNLTETNVTAAAPKANALSLAGMYSADPFYASLAYEEHKLDTVLVGGKEKATKLGLGYKADAFAVNFAYEKTSDNLTAITGANKYGHSAYYLAGKYNITSTDAVKLAYSKSNQIGATLNSGANQFSLGYDHNLSKRTKVYAMYSRINNQAAAANSFSQTTAISANGIGASPSVISLGMSHTF